MPIRHIAVGIDGSVASTDATAWAVGLARSEDATLQPIQAWHSPFTCADPWPGPSTQEEIQHAHSLIDDTLRKVGVGQDISASVVKGAAGPALIAASTRSDLLVLGQTGEALVDYSPQFGEVLVGATARYCVNHSRVPVATVPARAAWTEAPHVVIGIDGSPGSIAALRWAATRLPGNAKLHALAAVSAPDADFAAELLDPIVDRHRTELRRLVDEHLPETFVAAGRTVETHVVLGHAHDALTAPGFPCDLLVLGEHGSTAARPGVLGSVSDHTLRYATVPLIVVPAQGHSTIEPEEFT